MVHFRKRLRKDIIGEISELIDKAKAAEKAKHYKSDNNDGSADKSASTGTVNFGCFGKTNWQSKIY